MSWYILKVANEAITLAVEAESYESAVAQFEEQLQRVVDHAASGRRPMVLLEEPDDWVRAP